MRRWQPDHFALVAPFYDRLLRAPDPERLRAFLALPIEGLLLDVGGGTGRIAHTLRGLAGQIIVTDLSASMLAQAAQKDGILPVRAHAEKLPFPNASAERVLVVDAFHHFCDQRAAAAELWRVLKPGGRLLVEEPNVEKIAVKAVALAERLALMRSRFFSPLDIKGMFESLGGWVEVHTDRSFNAWVIATKRGSSGH